jgi:[ribosomal protein S5]-alanine N-acetyltransferase
METERLILRPLSRDDVDAWTAFMTDGEARAGLHTPDPVSAGDAASALDRFVDVAEMYTLVVRASGETAGFVGFIPRTMDWGEELELGWMLLPAHRGSGYATEAARALHATKDRRIISLIRTDNPASESVARRIGAEREHVFEYWGYETGVWVS